jgi:hypothetical protein
MPNNFGNVRSSGRLISRGEEAGSTPLYIAASPSQTNDDENI